MASCHFNFKGLVALHLDGVSAENAEPLVRRWARWRQDGPPAGAMVIRVSPVEGQLPLAEPPRQFDPNAPFLIREREEGDGWVTFFYKTRPDIFLRLGETIEVRYRSRPRQGGKLYGLLLFVLQLALARRGALLFHGAVVQRGEECLVLTGPEDTKKTTLLLPFLREGWDFLSDDLFLLYDRRAYLFASDIPLREHHFEAMPWLQQQTPGATAFRKTARRNRRLLVWARRLPGYCFPLVSRFFPDPSLVVAVERLFPQNRIVPEARPTGLILLALGETLRVTPLSRETSVARLAHIHRLLFPDYLVLEQMLVIYEHMEPIPYERILAENLAGLNCLGLALPVDGDPEAASNLARKEAVALLASGRQPY
jgi:hypothetical protein